MLWESWARKDVQFEAAQKLQFTREGAAILRYQEQLVKDACKEARAITLDGHAVLAVNATCLISEITGRLALDRPFGCSFRVRPDGKTEWSLRSSPEGLDVSEIARKHGGGGHRHAAGFVA